MRRKIILKKRIFKSKKGIGLPFEELATIIVAVGIVLFLIYVGYSLFSFFSSDTEFDSSVNNLNALSTNIREMIIEKERFVTSTMPFYLSENYILVGFNYDNKGNAFTVTRTNEKIVSNQIPTLCNSKSCLCIYKNEESFWNWFGPENKDFKEASPLNCEVFNRNIIFLAPYDPSDNSFGGGKSALQPVNTIYDTNEYEYLFIYGKDFKVKNLYVEKYTEGENIFIFLGKYREEENDPVNKRRKYIEENKDSFENVDWYGINDEI